MPPELRSFVWMTFDVISGVHRFRHFGNNLENLRRGHDFVANNVETNSAGVFSTQAFLAMGARAAVNVPLLERGRFQCFFVLAAEPRAWSAAECVFRTMLTADSV